MANRIFAITPGRSGMHYVKFLCKNLTNLPDTAIPEYFPEPKFYHDYLEDKHTASKKAAIAANAWNKMPEVFFSTSALTKNGYLMALMALGARFVSLRRNTRTNAYSWYLMNGAPGEHFRGIAYHPSIESKYNVLKLRVDYRNLTTYQKCLWLVLETKARAQYMVNAGAEVYFADLEDLNYKFEVDRLFSWMGIEYDMSKADEFIGQIINPMKNESRELKDRMDVSMEEMIKQEQELNNMIILNPDEIRI